MRKLLSVALVGALLVTAAAPVAATDAGGPFTRSWSAVDVDGSVMTLTFVGTGETRTVTYHDLRATTCGGGAYTFAGVGTIVGTEIHVVGGGGCVGGSIVPGEWTWTYQADSRTLTDGTVAYHRGNWAREAFLGVWKATDVDGSAMKLTFRGSDILTREVSYLDHLATSCDPDAVFTATGTGTIGSKTPWGKYITVSLDGRCVGGASIDVADAMYRYDYLTDTLRGPLDLSGGEVFGIVDWHRGG
jgi:hypothetical protein